MFSPIDPSFYLCLREYHTRYRMLSCANLQSYIFPQLLYLIIVVATKKAALPTIALAMLAVTYGLQVRKRCAKNETYTFKCVLGSYFPHQTRVYAHWMDGCLSPFVSRFGSL